MFRLLDSNGYPIRNLVKIIIHCSDSRRGSAKTIDKWHREKGWSGIGYHYVIGRKGQIEKGRPIEKQGAHVEGHNEDSIGICLVGKGGDYTMKQIRMLKYLVSTLQNSYNISNSQLFGHYQFNDKKTCPDFLIEDFKAVLHNL